jgi:LuxR family maltose regulon positive regulatory protein
VSELECERDDLQAATQHLLTAKELGERTGFPPIRARWCAAMARIREAQGDLDGALDLLDEAERMYVPDFSPNVRPVAAVKARVWVAHGRLGEALGWARAQELSVEDDLNYLREFEHITFARVLLAGLAMPDAMRLLERLLRAADDGARTGSVIEILVLQALAHQMRGNVAAALVPLERALTLAEPEGYVRIFVDEGLPMAALLEAAAKRRIAPDYTRQLLNALGKAEHKTPVKQDFKRIQIEPLSERELDVLRLLGTELNGPEIARHLTVSLNTVRTHTKNLYTKLGVNSRRAAVRRADELELFF